MLNLKILNKLENIKEQEQIIYRRRIFYKVYKTKYH